MTRIAISGVSGRMGRVLVEGCHEAQGIRLGAAIDRSDSPALGQDAGELAGLGKLGVVVRGETPHFDYVAGQTARVLAEVAREHALPVGFGVLTTDTMDQAIARAGGDAGDKGYEAAEAALSVTDLVSQLLGPRAEN